MVPGRITSEIRHVPVPEQHDQSAAPTDAPADAADTRIARYDLDSLDEVIKAPASQDEVHAYAREIGMVGRDRLHRCRFGRFACG